MGNSFTLKRIMIAVATILLIILAFLTHALAGLNANPVIFAEPPAFVENYVTEMGYSTLASPSRASGANNTKPAKMTADFSSEREFVYNVFFGDESLDELLHLFTHVDKEKRVKIASAFAAVNAEFTHNEESGFPEKREQFWNDVKKHLPDIQNALFEALITSAEEGTANIIPYTLAWMPGQGQQTVELLAWAAKHHPDWWIRRFSVYFVVKFGQNEGLASSLLESRTHDPHYKVRREVLDLRFQRLIGEI